MGHNAQTALRTSVPNPYYLLHNSHQTLLPNWHLANTLMLQYNKHAVQTGKKAVKYMLSITHLSSFMVPAMFMGAVCLTACVEHMEIKNDQNYQQTKL